MIDFNPSHPAPRAPHCRPRHPRSRVQATPLLATLFLSLALLSISSPASTFDKSRAYKLRMPQPLEVTIESKTLGAQAALSGAPEWLEAVPRNSNSSPFFLGSRLVLHLDRADSLEALVENEPVEWIGRPADGLFILQFPSPEAALKCADRLASQPGVRACYPVVRKPNKLHGLYAPRPDDPFFFRPDEPNTLWQPHLENRDKNGRRAGVDLNVRAAWPYTRGADVVIAVADNGVDLAHPDLADRVAGAPHFNFNTGLASGLPSGSASDHGTLVAGLAAASQNNGIGVSGVAPEARIASWVLFNSFDGLELSDEDLMRVYQYRRDEVAIQNHSWGKVGDQQVRLTALENLGIQNGIDYGRRGLGTIFVRSAGNDRAGLFDANDDGYLADPRVISVAAARLDGRVARYSNPGACILVSAPSGDATLDSNPCLPTSPNLTTTDRRGAAGWNRNVNSEGAGDYAFGIDGFSGTSASAPLISGVVALILGANPDLSYRDVQQVLIHSARQWDQRDPDLQVNGAGFQVSHNQGFGIPDAGLAVQFARSWINRPPATRSILASTNQAEIPDQGLRLKVIDPEAPEALPAMVAMPSTGVHPSRSMPPLKLVDLGKLLEPVDADLVGSAALIERGGNLFCEKAQLAADAGASLAIIYNHLDTDELVLMGALDLVPIPVIFVKRSDGLALKSWIASRPDAQAQVQMESAVYELDIDETLLCEHVALRLDTDHTSRGDLRVTLVSPQGTESVMQHLNDDTTPGPVDWTYVSVLHFFEASAGTWKVYVSDESTNGVGSVKSVSLHVTGVPIEDSDRDGLDDAWERSNFGSLSWSATDDVDGDGYSNAREQILGADPGEALGPPSLDLALWDDDTLRLSWRSAPGESYRIQEGESPLNLLNLSPIVRGQFGESEWLAPIEKGHRFFTIESWPVTKGALTDANPNP